MKKFDAILEWLGLGSTSFHKRETEDENEDEGNALALKYYAPHLLF